MKTQPELIAKAIELGACKEGIEWAKNADADWKGIPYNYARWTAAYFKDLLTNEQVDSIVAANPLAAAECLEGRLSDEQVDSIVAANPLAAAVHLEGRLSDEQVDSIVAANPLAAAAYLSDRIKK